MKDFDALKDIWSGQASLPRLDPDDVVRQVKKNKSGYARKLLVEGVIMGAIILALIAVWTFSAFGLWTSHLSLFILISCCCYYFFVQLRDYRGISGNENFFEQPDKYISYLKNYRQQRYRLNTRVYTIYSVLIGLAFALYFVEVFVAAPLWQTFTGLSFTIAWFVICALLMKSYKRREQDRLNEIITNLEKLEKQFE